MKNSLRLIFVLSFVLVACSDHELGPGFHGQIGVAVAPTPIAGNKVANAGPTAPVSGGGNQLGVVIPTGTSVAWRLQNGLEGKVLQTQGNFRKGLNQVSTNLPKVANVMSAAGFDQVELLAYAACSDMTTGGTPLMQSMYNIQPTASISSNQSALVAAGLRILDQHTGGLASQGPAAAQLNTILTNLVRTEAGVASNTTTIAFMTVCIAAQTTGATMLGL